MIQTVRVRRKTEPDVQGKALLHDVLRLGITSILGILTARVYRLEGLSPEEAQRFTDAVLFESVDQEFTLNGPLLPARGRVIEVAYKPGVMNPEAASLVKIAKDLGLPLVAADSSMEYGFYGQQSGEEIDRILGRLLVNRTVQHVVTAEPTTLLFQGERGVIEVVRIREMTDDELMELSKDKLFLNLEEMRIIQVYYRQIGRDPFDAELETLAQTWSEHCGHKTFNARLIVDGMEKPPLMKRLKEEARRHFGRGFVHSAFHDNSGVIDFYRGLAVCGKVETHNSPSAIEPYGGAATGSGGVFRDIMGTGQGAKVVASTDIFCLAPPDLRSEELPPGCLHPDYLLRRVVAGVRDYGNRMGIPTCNGSLHFHPDFRAKPTVIVGSYGMIPVDQCDKGIPQAGDKIIVIGGRTGRDGIHGATFSSAEMTGRTAMVNSSAVQIGHPIEEKRTSDAQLACRNEGLIRAVTDCGAGGFSSAIGEMGSESGARIYLERALLKYEGLQPWEIWISESQERMVLAVAPENEARVHEICRAFNVESVTLGEFTDDDKLTVTYYGETACDLSMDFLHRGLPQRVMEATWSEPELPDCDVPMPSDWIETYCRVMAHPNVCSKEPIVRLYDHGVQGMNALSPYGGLFYDGPNDATILTPILGEPYGLVISHGLNPILNRIDPYWGSMWAIVEALSNYVAVGGNYHQSALIDNFIWPFPDPESLGALDQSVEACLEAMRVFKRPFVSGKDSLSSTYRYKDGTVLRIPPVLCVSAFGRIPDVRRTVSADFKKSGSQIVLLGGLQPTAMGGSVYFDLHAELGAWIPKVKLEVLPGIFEKLHQAIRSGLVLSCHDISEGGLAASLAEMCIGGDKGAWVDLSSVGRHRPDYIFFNETAGCFLLEVENDSMFRLSNIFTDLPWRIIGETSKEGFLFDREPKRIKVLWDGGTLVSVETDRLKAAWQKPMKEIFS